MANLAQKLRLILTIPCERASQLTSESMDRKLQMHERLAIRGHHLVCWSCRQFEKQLWFMRKVFEASSQRELASLDDGPKLDDEVKQRLKRLHLSDDS